VYCISLVCVSILNCSKVIQRWSWWRSKMLYEGRSDERWRGMLWWCEDRLLTMRRHQIVLREPGTASMRQCTEMIVFRTAIETDTSMWSSPVNYCQCLCFHRTVIRLKSDWSYFGGFCLARLEGDAFAVQRYPHRPIKFPCRDVSLFYNKCFFKHVFVLKQQNKTCF